VRRAWPPCAPIGGKSCEHGNHFFANSDLKRYSLGTKNRDLKYNPDGSLTIYVQADPPADALRANWLPAPKNADFSLFVRAYWPKAAVLDGVWTPPGAQRAEGTVGRQ